MNRFLGVALGLLLALLSARPGAAQGCRGFDERRRPTLREDAKNYEAIFYGYLAKSTWVNEKEGTGTSEIHVLEILKPHPDIAQGKTIKLARYLPITDPKNPPRFVIFGEFFKGKFEAERGIAVESQGLVQYVQQAIAQEDKNPSKFLAFYFPYLGHENPEIRGDAYREFYKADFKDVRAAAKHFDPDRIMSLMQDPHPSYLCDVLALQLGVCGKDKHALFLRECIASKEYRRSLKEILTGYTLLKPAAGLSAIQGILHNPDEEFLARYGSLSAVRFFVETCPNVLPRKDLIAALLPVLDQVDLADLVIDSLAKWKHWPATDKVLGLPQQRVLNPATLNAVLRFALQCPEPGAAAFVDQQRRQDPDLVRDLEEALGMKKSGVNNR